MGFLTAVSALAFLVIINIFAFALFGADKQAARDRTWRVSEGTLLLVALLGGSAGAIFGQQHFRHKTKKEPFRSTLYFIAAMHVAAIYAFSYRPTREAVLHWLKL